MLYFSAEKQPSINIELFNSIGTQRTLSKLRLVAEIDPCEPSGKRVWQRGL